MVIQYNDPWKDKPYGKLKGDKSESFCKIIFDEAQIHKSDNGYVVTAFVTDYQGVVRSYKPENPLTPGLCEIPFYDSEYEVKSKDKDGNWTTEKKQPSKFELALCDFFANSQEDFTSSDSAFKGEITHLPDAMLTTYEGKTLIDFVANNVKLEAITPTGKLPEYKVFKSKSNGNSWGKSKYLTPEEKVEFIVKQMEVDVKSEVHKKGYF